MSDNPYEAPTSEVQESPAAIQNPDGSELASRLSRLGGAILDGLILMVILLPVMFLTGYFERSLEASYLETIAWAIAGFVVYALVNFKPLSNNGQTWGKVVAKTRVTDLEGNKPPLNQLLFVRYLPMVAVGQIPFAGQWIGLANVLLIFRKDKRCGHDLIANTRVIKVEESV